MIKVFGSLKQRVLWKWDQESMPDLPSNVKLSKWLPQQDILGNEYEYMYMHIYTIIYFRNRRAGEHQRQTFQVAPPTGYSQ